MHREVGGWKKTRDTADPLSAGNSLPYETRRFGLTEVTATSFAELASNSSFQQDFFRPPPSLSLSLFLFASVGFPPRCSCFRFIGKQTFGFSLNFLAQFLASLAFTVWDFKFVSNIVKMLWSGYSFRYWVLYRSWNRYLYIYI